MVNTPAPHIKCELSAGGDTINELLIGFLEWFLNKLKKKKRPQQHIEIVNSVIQIHIHKD